jgi:hypothetical protein
MNKYAEQTKDLEDDPRGIARVAAKLAGQSLDEWLADAIYEKVRNSRLEDTAFLRSKSHNERRGGQRTPSLADERQTARALQEILDILDSKISRSDFQSMEETIEKRIVAMERKFSKALAALADALEDERERHPREPEGLGSEILEQLGRFKRRVA